MVAIFITFGTVALLVYLYASLRERSYINALSPFFAFYFATSFVFEPVFFGTATTYQYDVQAFAFIYTCDLANFLGLAFAYMAVIGGGQTANGGHPLAAPRSDLGWLARLFLFGSALIFLPVALQFR